MKKIKLIFIMALVLAMCIPNIGIQAASDYSKSTGVIDFTDGNVPDWISGNIGVVESDSSGNSRYVLTANKGEHIFVTMDFSNWVSDPSYTGDGVLIYNMDYTNSSTQRGLYALFENGTSDHGFTVVGIADRTNMSEKNSGTLKITVDFKKKKVNYNCGSISGAHEFTTEQNGKILENFNKFKLCFRLYNSDDSTFNLTFDNIKVSYSEKKKYSFINTDFDTESDFGAVQGEKCWYYQYNDAGGYQKYLDLEYEERENAPDRWIRKNAAGDVENYISSYQLQAGNGSLEKKTAFVWEAPYSGNINISTVGNICRASNWAATNDIEVNVAHTDAEFEVKNASVWSATIIKNDTVGEGNTYNIDMDVEKGDRIYFEMGCPTAANANINWKPTVKYNQIAIYTKGENVTESVSDLYEGDILNCNLLERTAINSSANLYLGVYDKDNRLRAVGNPTYIDIDNFDDRIEMASVTMPALQAGEDNYDGWRISPIGMTDIEGRSWMFSMSDMLSIK